MNSPGSPWRIVVVGGGPVGLLQALLLAQEAKLQITVLDPGHAPKALEERLGFRVYALSRASQRVLTHTGVWSGMTSRASPYERMVIWESGAKTQPEEGLVFCAEDNGEPNLGHIVDHDALVLGLFNKAQAAQNVDVRFGTAIDGVEPAQRRVRGSDGVDYGYDLLIGADGSASRVREAFEIPLFQHSYQQRALVGHVASERSHGDTAWQCFLPTGPVALLPLVNGECGFVWSVDETEAAKLQDLQPKEFSARLTTATDGAIGELQLTSAVGGFPLQLIHAKRYCEANMVLVGDAAHTVHPLAGQGLNLGMLDAAALAEVVSEALGRGQCPGDRPVLRSYERWRKSDNLAMAMGLDGIHRFFKLSAPGFPPLRQLGMSAISNTPLVRQALMARAMGLHGDLPAAAKFAA